MKKIILSVSLLVASQFYGQVKFGANLTQIVPGNAVQVNGTATGTSFTSAENAFTVNLNGDVGIGTTSPNSDLDIVSLGTSASPRTVIALRNTNSGGHNWYLNSEGNFGTTQNANAGGFLLWDGTANADRMFISATGNVGFGLLTPSERLHVNGNTIINGGVTAAWIQGPSDIRFKKNVVPLQNSLDKIASLNGYNYEWRRSEFPDRNFKEGIDMGLIAQEVEKVFPEVVYTAKDDMQSKSIDYTKLIPALVESIKELKTEVESLKAQLAAAKGELASAK